MDPLRVLIVDDEEELVGALVERLGLRGIEAEGVTDGELALARLGQQPCDVVVLDVKMPGLGGLDLIRSIKERWPELQVILLTGHGSRQDAQEGMALGAYDYLMKPVKLDDLIGILRKATAASGGTKA